MKSLKNEFEKYKLNKKIGHAFLLYNINYENINVELNDVINSYFFNDEEKIKEIYIVEPKKNTITKEQIKQLQDYLKSYSQLSTNKVYVIKECEKMNLSAANSMLKILEEPQNNIYAFLITTDIDKVLPTIISRCIKIFVENKKLELDESIKEESLEILNLLFYKSENENIDKIYNKLKTKEKEEIKRCLENLIILLKDLVNIKLNMKTENYKKEEIYKLSNSVELKDIIEKIEFLNDIVTRLDYNINANMFIDKLIVNW